MKKTAKKALKKALSKSPRWLQHVQINKPPGRARTPGSFGAAGPVVRIDPATGQTREE